jgi:enoyl-[acyl-carrier protein] reductase I
MKTLQLTDKTFLITGVANRKSIAFSVAKSLEESGARVILTFQNDDIAQKTLKLFPDVDSYIVDVENQDSIDQLRDSLKEKEIVLDGFLHSMAYANYLNPKPFHETSYGYMGPIKATLDASVSYLAKSFSAFSKVRFNAVCAGPLKTSASSGIPGYIDNYLYAEKLTLRKEALKTEEVANTALFLLSPLSTGINATGITVDAGMSCNYFDQDVVKTTVDNS